MKIVALSDIHRFHDRITLPPGDVLVVGGDVCGRGSYQEFADFAKWLVNVADDYIHVIVIGGNHDRVLESMAPGEIQQDFFENTHNVTYLEDSGIEINGVKFWGSPYSPEFCGWAFALHGTEQSKKHWAKIPEDTDVLITHGPPRGVLDLTRYDKLAVGCNELYLRVMDILPKVHIFGHIHEGYGSLEQAGVRFYNVSVCTVDYKPTNPVTVIDV